MSPPGLNLDFLFGRGYLSANNLRVGEFATVESLRMEIPDLTFPFDARGGVGRFRNTRCQLRQLRLQISETGLDAALSRAIADVPGYEELRVRFVEGAIHVATRVRTLGSDTFLTFKLSPIPPEPARGDTIHLFFYDVRPYGPLPYPSRLLVSELASRLMQTAALTGAGVGPAFDVSLEGDLVELRPIKLCLLEMFPRHGWKLPSVAGLRFESVTVRPGVMSIAVRGDGQPWEQRGASHDALAENASTRAGAQALAAYEARDLMEEADAALFEGQLTQALDTLRGLRERYGLHPSIVDGLLDTLLAAPGPGHVAEARAVVEELLRADPGNLRGHLAAPTLALLRGDQAGAVRAYEELAELLRDRGETSDLVAALLAGAMIQRRSDAEGAVRRLREVTRLAPRNRIALEMLRDLYAATDDVEGQVDVLRQLTGLYAERDTLLDVYERLASLLMDRRNDLTEARLYLEKTLRLDPGRLQALFSLGESYVLDGQPLRAIRAFGSAARAAQQRGDVALATRLHVKVAELWRDLEDYDSARLECRRALALTPDHRAALELGVVLARDYGSVEEVLSLLDRLVPLVERAADEASSPEARAAGVAEARRVHIFAAGVAATRRRPDTAAAHHRKALAYRRIGDAIEGPAGEEADPSVDFLDDYYRKMGKPEDLIELYQGELEAGNLSDARRGAYHRTLATIFDQVLKLGSEAADHLREALDIDPDDDVARGALVELMSRRQRHFELRDILADLLPRARSRAVRGRILLELGRLHLDAIADAPEAARRLREAQSATPADPDIAAALVEAEKRLLEQGGAPEDGPELLLRALERQAEVTTEDESRVQALLSAGDLALDRLQRPEAALAFFRRARTVDDSPLVKERVERAMRILGIEDPRPSSMSLTTPTQADLDHARAQQAAMDLDFRPTRTPEPPRRDMEPTRPRRAGPSASSRPSAQGGALGPRAPGAALPGDSGHGEVLHGERSRDPLTRGEFSPPAPTRPTSRSTAELPSVEPPARPAPPSEGADVEGDELESFRSRLKEVQSKPSSLADSMDVVRKISGSGIRAVRPSASGADLAEDPDVVTSVEGPPDAQGVAGVPAPRPATTPDDKRNAIIARIAEARAEDDPVALRDVLATFLLDPHLDAELTARLHRDLGMLYYYDLEDPSAAEPHLTDARKLDPDGIGAEFEVLTALEGIYEDLDTPEGLVDIYDTKLARASDPDMAVVYGLLKAELLWERLQQAEAARAAIDDVLAIKRNNEPALRMLADICRAEGDTESALRLLRQIRDRHGEGSFERLEALRELGRVLVAEADAVASVEGGAEAVEALRREAADTFRTLMEESPGESGALTQLKVQLELLGEFDQALELLGRELGLLLGRPDAFPQGPSPQGGVGEVAETLSIPASQIVSDAARLYQDKGDARAATALFGEAVAIWPENVDALGARIALLRQALVDPDLGDVRRVEVANQLCESLRRLADMLFSPVERFEALFDAAEVILLELDDEVRGREALEEALALIDGVEVEEEAVVSRLEAARAMMSQINRGDAVIEAPPPEALALEPEEGPLPLLPPTSSSRGDDDTPSLVGERRHDFGLGDSLDNLGWLGGGGSEGPSLLDGGDAGEGDGDASGWFDMPSDVDALLGAPDDSSDWLQAVDLAEQKGDRAKLLEALDQALDGMDHAPSAPASVRRQLLVRKAQTLLGERPAPPPGRAPRTPTLVDATRALAVSAEALAIENADEPEAYFLQAASLGHLGRHGEALDVLVDLAGALRRWDEELGLSDDEEEMDMELEERIASAALELTRRGGEDVDEMPASLQRFSAANPRVGDAIETRLASS